jgi:hypothetical protein
MFAILACRTFLKGDSQMKKIMMTLLLLAIALPLLSTSSALGKGARQSFGFNAKSISGFINGGEVSVTGGGAYDPATFFVKSAGGFSCLQDVLNGPLSQSINEDDPGPCLQDEGVRWDTAALLTSTTFKCTGAAEEGLKTAFTGDDTIVIQADFYRQGDGNEESFTAKMIVSETDLADDIDGIQNVWIQGVGCGEAIVNFN